MLLMWFHVKSSIPNTFILALGNSFDLCSNLIKLQEKYSLGSEVNSHVLFSIGHVLIA